MDTCRSTSTRSSATSGDRARGTRCARTGRRSTSVTMSHDVAGARAAGACPSGSSPAACTAAELREAGPTSCSTTSAASRTGSTSTCWRPACAPSRSDCGGGQRPRRLQRWRRLGLPPRCGGARPGSRPRGRRHRRLGLSAGGRAGPGRGVRGVPRGRHVTPETHEMDREGYRANAGDRCYFCKAELVDVLGPLAARLGLAAVATGTNADDAVAGFRPGIRAAAERGAVTPLLDAGLTKAQVRECPGAGTCRPGTSPRPPACRPDRVRHRGHVGRLSRVERAEAGRARGAGGVRRRRCATCGSATSGTRPASRSTPTASTRCRTDPASCVAAVVAAGFDLGVGRPEGVPLGVDERATRRPDRFR